MFVSKFNLVIENTQNGMEVGTVVHSSRGMQELFRYSAAHSGCDFRNFKLVLAPNYANDAKTF